LDLREILEERYEKEKEKEKEKSFF